MSAPRPAWAGVFSDLRREHGYEPLRCEGRVPPELAGTLVRCGPARSSCFGHRYRHAFDGDGAVTAVRFAQGAAWGATRLVETPGLIAEREAGRALFPAYGTLPPGPRRPMPRPKNAANIAVLTWASRTFALHESSPPTEVELDELRTLGERDFELPEIQLGFTAHPHEVPARGATYGFGVRYGASSAIDLFELGAHRARYLGAVALAGPTMLHDFAATPRHLVFLAPPLRLDVRAFATGMASYSDAMIWTPREGTEVIVVPIDAPDEPVRFTVEPFFQWHLVNAYEEADAIVVDVIRYPDFASNQWFASLVTGDARPGIAQGQLTRARIDRHRRRITTEPLTTITTELPRVAPAVAGARHHVVYAAAHSSADLAHHPHDSIARIETSTGRTQLARFVDGELPSEPVFLPRGGAEEDGWLATLVYSPRAHASFIAIFDAAHIDDGPIARAWFDQHIPYTFHGIWIPRGATS